MNAAVVAFTGAGASLALKVAGHLGCAAYAPEKHCLPGVQPMQGSVGEWAGRFFAACGALVFVGACGIAVRAIAPHIRSKTADPAVIVIDELGRHVIPILSGHIGGANALAAELAKVLGGVAVITTATDLNNIQAVDTWAAGHNCAIENPHAIKAVSSAALAGQAVGVAVTEQLADPPFPVTLWLRPRTLVLGVGCRKGVEAAALEAAAEDFLRGAGVSALSLKAVASIELKANEPAILAFCARHGLPFMTYGAEELSAVPGQFTASERVLDVTGVDNVCERAAVKCAGGGVLLRGKTIYAGITLALAKEGKGT
jgi:cobalt-precorrin 5A hydrolase